MTDQINYTPDHEALVSRIMELKTKRNAVFLCHNYQRPEVQDIADVLGDSLALAQQASDLDCEVIVFCGVHFMAESAAMLSPEKTVLLPRLDAGCPMADMVTADALKLRKKELGDVPVVCYINSSAAVKAESSICCTSGNAIRVVESVDADRVLFVPDRNLGAYIQRFTKKDVVLWDGYCNTHDRLTSQDIQTARELHPRAKVVVHPECTPEVIDIADGVRSTSGMISWSREVDRDEIIVGTEGGMVHRLEKEVPEKKFYLASRKLVCPAMKLTSLQSILFALENMNPRITVDDETGKFAIEALNKMLAVPRDIP
ncbi:quinolinate synthase NadA [Acidobacteriota bacterium]